MNTYKTIAAPVTAAYTEKKSAFIAAVSPVSTEAEASAFIAGVKAANRKARHNCHAYILRENNLSRHSDDGEPAGTAGTPIAETLRKENLTDTACVVTRYFGGILLGAAGLTRAYGKAAALALAAADIITFTEAAVLRIEADYALYGKIRAFIAETGGIIREAVFTDKVDINAALPSDKAKIFVDELNDLCNGKVVVQNLQTVYINFG